MLIGYDGVNSYWVYSPLTKRVKTYCNVKFCKYETTHNTDINNKFQYTEFNEYEKLETIKINIPESTNQNTSTESNIESSTEVQNIGSHNVSPEPMNTNITSHHSEHNQQSICHQKNEFYYNLIHEIKTLQHITFISTITLSINDDLKNLHKIMVCED